MHPSFVDDLERDDAYGDFREDRGLALQPEPLPCCLCDAGIELGDRIGLLIRPGGRDEHVIFWTHQTCMDEALHRKYRRDLHRSGIYGT